MDTVKLLIQGYAYKKENGRWDATSATVLVRSAGKLVLIDPGCRPSDLKSALKNEGLRLEDIDIITATHSHYDHARNARLFDKVKVFNPFALNRQREPPANPVLIPGTSIEIVITPGHVAEHAAFLVDTAAGKCAGAGDVFWWEDGEEQRTDRESLISHEDPVALNMAVLRNSRRKLIDLASRIIPGHGKEFTPSR